MNPHTLRRGLGRWATYAALVAGLAVLSSTPGIADGAGVTPAPGQVHLARPAR